MNPASASIVSSSASSMILTFLIVFGITQDCSPVAISIFLALFTAAALLLLPAAGFAVVAAGRGDGRKRLAVLLLGLDASLLFALLALI